MEEVNAFEMALDEAGIQNTVTVYDGMNHAFVQPDAINEAGAPQEAWQEILEFLETTFNDESSS